MDIDTLKMLHKYVGISREMIEKSDYFMLACIIIDNKIKKAKFICSISSPRERKDISSLSHVISPNSENYHAVMWFVNTFKITREEFERWSLVEAAVCRGPIDLIKFYHEKYKISIKMFFEDCLQYIVIWNRMDILEYLYSELKFTKDDATTYSREFTLSSSRNTRKYLFNIY